MRNLNRSVRNPIVAEDYVEPTRLHDFGSFAEHFESWPDWFVRVKGDSLDRLGYRSGDILAVRREPEPPMGHSWSHGSAWKLSSSDFTAPRPVPSSFSLTATTRSTKQSG